jgi:hypothetical protein
MRSYTVWGICEGLETLVSTVHSAEEGQSAHEQMRVEGHYDHIRVRDCLGGTCFVYNLQTGQKVG